MAENGEGSEAGFRFGGEGVIGRRGGGEGNGGYRNPTPPEAKFLSVMVLSDLPLEFEGLNPNGGDGIIGGDGESNVAEIEDTVLIADPHFSTMAGGDAFPELEATFGE